MASKRSVLITGCSEGGLGDALARAFRNKGFRVLATARNPKKMAHFADLGIETVVLDVMSQESIDAAVQVVSQLTGGTLDILLNNSGIGYMLPIADAEISKVQNIFNVNVISNISMIQAFLLLLRKAAPGSMIVNNTSISSVACLPMQGIYSATKAAMSAMSDSLRLELAPFGIKVVELKTGSVRSRFFDNQDNGNAKLPENTMYEPARDALEEVMNGKNVMAGAVDSDVYAKQVVADLTRTKPPTQIWRGGNAWMVWLTTTLLPHAFTDGILAKMGGLDILAERLQSQKKGQ